MTSWSDGMYVGALHSGSSVVGAVSGYFIHPSSRCFAVTTSNSLEIFVQDEDGEFVNLHRCPVYTSIETVVKVPRVSEDGVDCLFIVCSNREWLLLRRQAQHFQVICRDSLEEKLSPCRRIFGVLTAVQHVEDDVTRVFVFFDDNVIHMVEFTANQQQDTYSSRTNAFSRASNATRWTEVSTVIDVCVWQPKASTPFSQDISSCFLAVLRRDGQGIIDIECVAVELSSSSLRAGPWEVGNVHDSACFVLDCGPDLGGIVCVTNHNISFFDHTGKVAEVVISARVATAHSLCDTPGSFVVGGLEGSLYLLRVTATGQLVWRQVALEEQLSQACALCALGVGGVLFWGSRVGPSFMLELSEDDCSASLLSDSLFDHFGPIVAASCVHRLGCGEGELVMATGVGVDSRLRSCKYGMRLAVTVSDGPDVPGATFLKGVKKQLGDETHSYLVFSFSVGQTLIMELVDNNFAPISLLGFNERAVTLDVAATSGGHVVQITAEDVCTLGPMGVVDTWKPPSSVVGIHLACIDGDAVLVATDVAVYYVFVRADGMISLVDEHTFPSQVSAISLFCRTGTAPLALVSLWVSNTTNVLECPDSTQSKLGGLRLLATSNQESTHSQSVIAVDFGGHVYVLVGQANGLVCCYEYRHCSLSSPTYFKVSESDVSFFRYSVDKQDYIFAHSTADAVIYPSSDSEQSALLCARILSPLNLRAICSVHTQSLPQSLAWISASDTLAFGALDTELVVGGPSKSLGQTALYITFHASSNSAVVLTEDVAGQAWMRVFHLPPPSLSSAAAAEEFVEVWGMHLDEGHCWSALLSAEVDGHERLVTLSYVTPTDSLAAASSLMTTFSVATQSEADDSRTFLVEVLAVQELPFPAFFLASLASHFIICWNNTVNMYRPSGSGSAVHYNLVASASVSSPASCVTALSECMPDLVLVTTFFGCQHLYRFCTTPAPSLVLLAEGNSSAISSALLFLDSSTFLMGDLNKNMFLFQLRELPPPPSSATDEEAGPRFAIETLNGCGSTAGALSMFRGGLGITPLSAPPSPSSSKPQAVSDGTIAGRVRRGYATFVTSSGSVGVVASLTNSEFSLLNRLQSCLLSSHQQSIDPVTSHDKMWAPCIDNDLVHAEGGSVPDIPTHVVSGHVVTAFLGLSATEQEAVAKVLHVPPQTVISLLQALTHHS